MTEKCPGPDNCWRIKRLQDGDWEEKVLDMLIWDTCSECPTLFAEEEDRPYKS